MSTVLGACVGHMLTEMRCDLSKQPPAPSTWWSRVCYWLDPSVVIIKLLEEMLINSVGWANHCTPLFEGMLYLPIKCWQSISYNLRDLCSLISTRVLSCSEVTLTLPAKRKI